MRQSVHKYHCIKAADMMFFYKMRVGIGIKFSFRFYSLSWQCQIHAYIALAVYCRQSRAVSHCQQMLRMATAGLDSYCPACLLPCATPVAAPAAPLHHPPCSSWDSQQQAAEQPVYVQRPSSNAEGHNLTDSEGSKSGKIGQVRGSKRDVIAGGSDRKAMPTQQQTSDAQQQASDAQQQILPSLATAEAGNVSEPSNEQVLAWVSVSSSCIEDVLRQNIAVSLLHAHASAFCSCRAIHACAC